MKCEEYQNLILDGEITSTHKHLASCEKCREFLKMQEKISSLDPNRGKCPAHLTFESIWDRSVAEKHPLINLKWAIPAAAAVLLILSYLPYRYYQKTHTLANGDFTHISQTISFEMDELEQSIEDMEMSILSADNLIENEMDAIINEINNLEV